MQPALPLSLVLTQPPVSVLFIKVSFFDLTFLGAVPQAAGATTPQTGAAGNAAAAGANTAAGAATAAKRSPKKSADGANVTDDDQEEEVDLLDGEEFKRYVVTDN